jgi:hypothetical protein
MLVGGGRDDTHRKRLHDHWQPMLSVLSLAVVPCVVGLALAGAVDAGRYGKPVIDKIR